MQNTRTLLLSSEFSLTIALVVFVMITLFLVTIIVLLCVSKSFRAFFFREHKNSVENSEVAATPQQSEPNKPTEPKPRRKKSADPFGVPTVPLTFHAMEPETKKGRGKKSAHSSDGVKTIEIEAIAPQSEKTTYITRTTPKKPEKRR